MVYYEFLMGLFCSVTVFLSEFKVYYGILSFAIVATGVNFIDSSSLLGNDDRNLPIIRF